MFCLDAVRSLQNFQNQIVCIQSICLLCLWKMLWIISQEPAACRNNLSNFQFSHICKLDTRMIVLEWIKNLFSQCLVCIQSQNNLCSEVTAYTLNRLNQKRNLIYEKSCSWLDMLHLLFSSFTKSYRLFSVIVQSWDLLSRSCLGLDPLRLGLRPQWEEKDT